MNKSSEKLHEFIAEVDNQQSDTVSIKRANAVAARDFIDGILKARSKGGKKSRRVYKSLSTEPGAVKTRERVRRYRDRRKRAVRF